MSITYMVEPRSHVSHFVVITKMTDVADANGSGKHLPFDVEIDTSLSSNE